MSEIDQPLTQAGMVLFLLGLLNGFIIPFSRSPRLSLSAHLTAVQTGTFLIAVGLLWPALDIATSWNAPISHGLWISAYALWLALFFAGLLGAGRHLPIAGQGIRTKPVYQYAVSALLFAGIAGTTIATAIITYWAIA